MSSHLDTKVNFQKQKIHSMEILLANTKDEGVAMGLKNLCQVYGLTSCVLNAYCVELAKTNKNLSAHCQCRADLIQVGMQIMQKDS